MRFELTYSCVAVPGNCGASSQRGVAVTSATRTIWSVFRQGGPATASKMVETVVPQNDPIACFMWCWIVFCQCEAGHRWPRVLL